MPNCLWLVAVVAGLAVVMPIWAWLDSVEMEEEEEGGPIDGLPRL